MNKLLNSTSINGIIQVIVSLFWVLHFGELLYQYHYTDILFYFMYPNWTLVLFILMGLIGALIGLSVFLKKRKIKNGYFLLIGLFVFGLIIDLIVVS
ncbi:hypothetical protein SAMN04489761_3567 [Tenacibaculum sp. MAR_2009_124]|uniref:hypothetical protein n=1 Tax=Tenacibaculum sp. MAR_2009_124 TaxID=1250059 RepID=UPI0008986B08|nr:hypothetical protein [Tenacibaculum sp. MAR_2009_124]SEC78304.1 hypothetical protein SAMN04489761_3567 [Tenacibaculum sp. MAR_2009_124]